jgi:1-phosphatidylinositol-3-phosphate 5-kinase
MLGFHAVYLFILRFLFLCSIQDQARSKLRHAISQDSFMLQVMQVIDYSLLVGIDNENQELVVGIIDYLRHYDLIKKMESGVKHAAMLVGQREVSL